MMKDQEKIGIFQGNHYRRSKYVFDFFPQNKAISTEIRYFFHSFTDLVTNMLKILHSDVVIVSFIKEHLYPRK